MPGGVEPQAVLQHRQELGGDEPVFARQVADLLLHEVDSAEVLGTTDQDGVAEQHAVLGAAHGDDVRVADRLGRRDTERGNGIGDPRAVDVHQQAAGVGVFDEPGDGGRGPHPAVLGGLGDADDAGLGVMDHTEAGEPVVQLGGCDQAVITGQPGELRSGEPDRPACFVEQDVGDVAAQDFVPWPHRRGQRDDVGRGSGEREEHLGVRRVEGLPEGVGRTPGDGIGAVGRGGPDVDVVQRLQRPGVRRGGVVRGKRGGGRRHGDHSAPRVEPGL